MKKYIIGILTLVFIIIVGLFSWFFINKNNNSNKYGKIDSTTKVTENAAKKGAFSELSLGNGTVYDVVKINGNNNSIDMKDYLYQWDKEDRNKVEHGITFIRRNIPSTEISALIPEKAETIYDPSNAGWHYYKSGNVLVGITVKDSTDKSIGLIQSEMKDAISAFGAHIKGVWYTVNDYQSSPFMLKDFDKSATVYVSNGSNGKDYIQVPDGNILENTSEAKKQLRYLEVPELQLADSGQPVEFESSPFVQFNYSIVGNKIVLTAVFAPAGDSNKAAAISQTISKNIGNSSEKFATGQLIASDYMRIGQLSFPTIKNAEISSKTMKTKDNEEVVSFAQFKDVQGVGDLSGKKEFLSPITNVLMRPDVKETNFDAGNLSLKQLAEKKIGDWQVSISQFDYITSDPYSKDNKWLIDGNGSYGVLTTFYNADKKELVVMAVRGTNLKSSYKINDYITSYTK